MSEKMIEVRVQLSAKIHNALTWYVEHTQYWKGNDKEQEAISDYAAHIIESWLKMEAGNPQDAVDSIKAEMEILLQ